MLMNSEASVNMVVQNFLTGNYRYDREFLTEVPPSSP